jgi:hypothetical protein
MSDIHGVLAVIRAAFDLRKPDSFDLAARHRDRHLLAGRELVKRISQREASGRDASDLRRLAERQFLSAARIEALMQNYRHVNLLANRDDDGPTPEATLKPGRDDALIFLVERGTIDHRHHRAAVEIATILEAVTAAQHARCMPVIRSGGGVGPAGDFMPAFLADWHAHRYLPWIAEMLAAGQQNRNHLQLVLMVVRDGISLDTARRRHRLGWTKAVAFLRAGLDLYADIRADHDEGRQSQAFLRETRMIRAGRRRKS